MRAVVTGGAGFLGSHLCDKLLAEGWDVLAIDNFTTGRRDNLRPDDKVKLIEDTIVDGALVDRLFAEFKPEVVVHTAASYKDPDAWADAAERWRGLGASHLSVNTMGGGLEGPDAHVARLREAMAAIGPGAGRAA